MSDITPPDESDPNADDATFRAALSDSGFKPDAENMKFGPATPRVLVAGAYKTIRTAAERAREVIGRGKE